MSLSRCASDGCCYGSSEDLVEQHYREWVVIPFYVVVAGYNEYTQKQEYACFRSAKRGDKKYSDRVLSRFEDLTQKMPDQVFNLELFRVRLTRVSRHAR